MRKNFGPNYERKKGERGQNPQKPCFEEEVKKNVGTDDDMSKRPSPRESLKEEGKFLRKSLTNAGRK